MATTVSTTHQQIRAIATESVSFVVDDALNGRALGADQHAIVRERGEFKYASVLVGWQHGEYQWVVAVHSYLDVRLKDEEVRELSRDYLDERNGAKACQVLFIIR